LAEISSNVDDDTRLKIHQVLTEIRSPSREDTATENSYAESTAGGEYHVGAEVGSTGSLDHIEDDYDDPAKTTTRNFKGKSSEVSWIQRLVTHLTGEDGSSIGDEEGREGNVAQLPSYQRHQAEQLLGTDLYHLDDEILDDLRPSVNPYALPEMSVSEKLVDAYFSTVHSSFPILQRRKFYEQYHHYANSYQFHGPSTGNESWLGMLNLVFAIGSLHAHVVKSVWEGDSNDHSIYFARARLLALDGHLFDSPNVESVQLYALNGLYLMACYQTNRAWITLSLAIRHAQALGLHLRNESSHLTDVDKEWRVRLWYAIYALETLLRVETGRPGFIQDIHCSLPLPLPVDDNTIEGAVNGSLSQLSNLQEFQTPPSLQGAEKNVRAHVKRSPMSSASPRSTGKTSQKSNTPAQVPPNVGMYFYHRTLLNRLSEMALDQLYSPQTMQLSWREVQVCANEFSVSIIGPASCKAP
jgi:Fungal specific transcription factor domain